MKEKCLNPQKFEGGVDEERGKKNCDLRVGGKRIEGSYGENKCFLLIFGFRFNATLQVPSAITLILLLSICKNDDVSYNIEPWG